jgi:hypothetical protein
MSVAIIIAALLAWILVEVLGLGYSPRQFSGNGRVIARGFWSYPRYTVQFGDVDIGQDQAIAWSFTGAPAASVAFGIKFVDAAIHTSHRNSSAVITAGLSRADGKVLANVSGPISEWKLMSQPSTGTSMLWHPKLTKIPMTSAERYTLTLKIEYQIAPTQDLLGAVVLEGGGNELP